MRSLWKQSDTGDGMSLERDLRAEQVAYLDLSFFTTAEHGVSVRQVMERMRADGHGCALITQNNRLVGIFTERDILRKVIDRPETWDGPVDAVMTPNPDTVSPTEPVAAALKYMNRGHYRNVPVVDANGTIVGNLTHYAILRFFSDRFQQEIYNLPPDPDQVPKAPEGA
jgi:signal-transduction protein with cAMP-binding, CBS, and nucleotidyltransferase domain